MNDRKIWFITGAGRGMGVDFAKAALAAGHAVVASGRDPDGVAKALGQSDNLLAVKLDVTRRGDAEEAVRAAVGRFGRIDVLVNNAASFYAGYFEELTPEQMEEPPPRRFIAGADAVATVEQKVADLKAQTNAHRDLSTSLDLDREPAALAV